MIRYETDAGVATITWDVEDRPVNVMNRESMTAFGEAVDRALTDDAVTGIIVTSARKEFIVGADLERFLEIREPREVMALVGKTDALTRRLETSGKPVVAAINGSALGGGFEITLACHYRVVADREDIRLGLPEVKLGLLPGAGGTQRLARLIGARAALPLLLEGKRLSPARALKSGMVHRVVPADELLDEARRWLREDADPVQPWDRKGYRIPGGDVQSRQGYETFVSGNAMLRSKTYGNYPAPLAIMSCVYEGLQVPIEAGLRIETRYFTGLLCSDAARRMIRTNFFSMGRARNLAGRPKDVPAASFSRIGVLGAGLMGGGIACAAASAGLDVVVLDVSEEVAAKALVHAGRVLDRQAARRRLTPDQREAIFGRIHPTTAWEDLAGVEIVIEAVFEDREVKAEVTRQACAVLGPDAIFASNTSTLPIAGLATASDRPDRFIGLHFFSPVERMPLVEIIRADATSDRTLAACMDLVKLLGKTPIVVGDSRGFFTSRVFATYVHEGLAMLAEGVKPALIENAGRLAGMPMGPLEVADAVDIGLMHQVMIQTRADLGEAWEARPGDGVLETVVAGLGRTGKKAGRGFYDYPDGGPKRLWPDLGRHFPLADTQPDVAEVKRRMLHVQAVETARCLEEKVLADPRDADVGSILGWGFAPATGGVASWMDAVGVATFVRECEDLAAKHGPRFVPPTLLREMAARGETFHAG